MAEITVILLVIVVLLVVFSVYTSYRVADLESKDHPNSVTQFQHTRSLRALNDRCDAMAKEIKTLKADYMRVYGLEEEHWLDDVKAANNDETGSN